MHQVTEYTHSPDDQEVRSPYGKATLLITGISALIGWSLGSENSTHGIEVGIALWASAWVWVSMLVDSLRKRLEKLVDAMIDIVAHDN